MIAWVDLETTGLKADRERLLEIACIVTDDALNEVARYHAVTDGARHHEFDAMDPVVQQMHTVNGLWSESLRSVTPIGQVDVELAEFLAYHARRAQLGGSTISFDRSFMVLHLPRSEAMLHYRNIDVTSFNEIARRYWPDLHEGRPSAGAGHRAMDDIEDSIAAMRYYVRSLIPAVAS